MLVFDKDKAYMQVLWEFRKLIQAEYKDGGWLPPVRTLSKRFNVSTATITKAQNCLVSESMAESFPRKGIFVVPEKFRVKKIGIVVSDGRESPFLVDSEQLGGIFHCLREREYDCHLIQGSPVTNVFRCALTNCVSGLIWVYPAKENNSVLLDIYNAQMMPMIVISPADLISNEDKFPAEIPAVFEEPFALKKMTVKYFAERGHKNIGYVANYADVALNRIKEEMYEYGLEFNENCYTDSYFPEKGSLAKMVVDNDITVLMVEGTARTQDYIFNELSTMPAQLQPEVVIKEATGSKMIRESYPDIKVIAVEMMVDKYKKARAAVNMLIDNIDCPDKMSSVSVSSYGIVEV